MISVFQVYLKLKSFEALKLAVNKINKILKNKKTNKLYIHKDVLILFCALIANDFSYIAKRFE